MPRKFTEMLTDNAYKVRNRRDVKRFYQEVRDAVSAGTLGLDGHTLPTTMNAFIERVEGKPGAPSNDYDVVDFSLADNGKLKRWRQTYLLKDKRVNVSAEARELFERVKELAAANERSLGSTNGKKDDLLTALSDLQAAVALLLQSYDQLREGFKLPDRALRLTQVKVRRTSR